LLNVPVHVPKVAVVTTGTLELEFNLVKHEGVSALDHRVHSGDTDPPALDTIAPLVNNRVGPGLVVWRKEVLLPLSDISAFVLLEPLAPPDLSIKIERDSPGKPVLGVRVLTVSRMDVDNELQVI